MLWTLEVVRLLTISTLTIRAKLGREGGKEDCCALKSMSFECVLLIGRGEPLQSTAEMMMLMMGKTYDQFYSCIRATKNLFAFSEILTPFGDKNIEQSSSVYDCAFSTRHE